MVVRNKSNQYIMICLTTLVLLVTLHQKVTISPFIREYKVDYTGQPCLDLKIYFEKEKESVLARCVALECLG